MDQEVLDKMKGSVQVNEVNKDAFVKASKPVYEEFDKSVKGGKELIEKILELAMGC